MKRAGWAISRASVRHSQKRLETLYATGELEFYDKLVASVPSGLMDLLDIPGLGGKKIKVLHEQLNVDSIESLTEVCQAGKVAELKGFGEKTQEKILSGIKNREAYAARHLWWDARSVVENILPGLQGLPEVERVEAAGSFRRGMETVGDLDFLVKASSDPAPIMDWFTSMDGNAEVTAHGDTKSSIRLEGGMQADLRVVPSEQFYFALHHFTGSKDHNVRMRQKALSLGLSLSEWGLRPEEEKDSSCKADQWKQIQRRIFLRLWDCSMYRLPSAKEWGKWKQPREMNCPNCLNSPT